MYSLRNYLYAINISNDMLWTTAGNSLGLVLSTSMRCFILCGGMQQPQRSMRFCLMCLSLTFFSETLREATLKELDAGEGFRFKIRAKNGVGFSEWSVESRVFRTNAGARLMSR